MLNKILSVLILSSLISIPSYAQDAGDKGVVADQGEPTQYQGQSWRSAMRATDKDWDAAKNAYEKTMANYYANVYNQQLYQGQVDALTKKIEAAQQAYVLADQAITAAEAKKDLLNEKTLVELRKKRSNAELELKNLTDARKPIQDQLTDAQNTVATFNLSEIQGNLNTAAKVANANASVNEKKNISRGKKILNETRGDVASSGVVYKLDQEARDAARTDFTNRFPDQKVPVLPAKVAQAAPAVPATPAVVDKKPVPDANKVLCAAWTGKDSTAGDQYACELGGVKIGGAAIAQVVAPDPDKLTVQAQSNAIFKTFLARTGAQTCDEAGVKKACEDLGTATGKKIIVAYDSCALEGDDTHQSAPLISAKDFCQGPVGADGKATAFATLLGFTPQVLAPPLAQFAEADCDKVYVELAKLVLEKPENSKILSMMIQSAASRMASLTKGAGVAKDGSKGSLESYSQNPEFKTNFVAFESKLKDLYLGNSDDIKTVMDKVNGKAKYIDKNITKSQEGTTRFKNSDASALILYLSQMQGSGFSVSDASAIWAQGKLFQNLKYQYGKYDEKTNAHDNLLNFSNQVYLMNLTGKRSPASTGDSPEMMIQKAVNAQFTAAAGTPSIAQASLTKCLSNGANACTQATPTLGTESLEKIREKVSLLSGGKELEGLGKKLYTVNVKAVHVNTADGSYTADFETATKPAQ